MPWDLAMDPVTHDFVPDGAGGWQRTEHADTSVLHQLRCHFDAWWAEPELGSLFHERDRFAAAPADQVAAEVRRALGWLERQRVIADVQATAAELPGGRVVVAVRYREIAGGQLIEAQIPILR
jgi:phage gp46-like protein